MPDSPDYSKFSAGNLRFSLSDMGELAARLGSIHNYDRRGNIIWYYDFTGGLQSFVYAGTGTGNTRQIVSDYTYRSPYSLKMTTGSADGNYQAITKYLGAQVAGRCGVEVGVGLPLEFKYLQITFSVVIDGVRHRGQARITYDDLSVNIFDDTFTQQQVGTFKNYSSAIPIFRPVKFVFDTTIDKWVRFYFGDTEYDVSDHGIRLDNGSSFPDVQIDVYIYGNGSGNQSCYISHVILTSDEP